MLREAPKEPQCRRDGAVLVAGAAPITTRRYLEGNVAAREHSTWAALCMHKFLAVSEGRLAMWAAHC